MSLYPRDSYYADCLVRPKAERRSTRRLRKCTVALACLLIILAAIGGMLGLYDGDGSRPTAAWPATVDTILISLAYQHKDTNMICLAGPPCTGVPPDPPHAWNDAAGPDLIFGTADDCPHCSTYCAPASISMISAAYGRGPPFTNQDDIYDAGKVIPPEIPGDAIIQTHGVGMFDGSGGQPKEVQNALQWSLSLAIPITQHDFMVPLTPAVLQGYIKNMQPVLWLDHGGWPTNQSVQYPSSENRADQGHAKVIAGYDDNNTIGNISDDLCLIYDPWPEYDHSMILPRNATLGPGGTFDPYWLPLRDVNVSDVSDIFVVPIFAVPEFPTLLLPVGGMLLVAVFAFRLRPARRDR